jgi:hypothetical protein
MHLMLDRYGSVSLDVTELKAPLAEHLADQKPAMAVVGAPAAAQKNESVLASAVNHTVYCTAESRFASHLPV